MNGRDGALPDAHVYRATIDTLFDFTMLPCCCGFSQAPPER
jgi:hypothetical protein